ncbi:microcephalin isoform X1 [Scleropages formosus]|uniref:microcephalin isoform X1 n=2 Tax=Scleropages formosus TaxID=113540 RepID=UPI0010FAC7E5|nr:microcephalin isoform X1 [Scleropages formosus]
MGVKCNNIPRLLCSGQVRKLKRIVSDSEMTSTSTPATALKDVVAFVDVWSSSRTENYSRPFIRQLQDMGAEVSKTFNKQVTHVVFNHGHQSTWNKAKKLGVKLVSVLWVDGCKASGQHVDEESYPAINEESTVNKVVKNRKHRCLQPRDVLEKTPDNNRRMKRKLDQMIKDLVPSSHIPISDTSPFIIDEESAIVYSPLSRRAESMAHRLKEMKEKRENLSPTASQMVESQLSFDEPDVGTPTHDSMQPEDEDSSYNLSFEELHTKRDKKEGKWKDSIKLSHAGVGSSGTDIEKNKPDKLPHNTNIKKTPSTFNRKQVKKKTSLVNCAVAFSVESNVIQPAAEVRSDGKIPRKAPLQGRRRRQTVASFNLDASKSKILESPMEEIGRNSAVCKISTLESSQGKSKRSETASIMESPKNVNAVGSDQTKLASDKKAVVHVCRGPTVSLDDSASSGSTAGQKTGVMKGTEVPQRPRQRRKPSIPLDLRERSKPLSISTPDEDTVFEDYFSPANQQDGNRQRRPLSVTLSPESDPLPPFCLEPTRRKRKRVGSEDTPGDKKSHLETNTGSKHRVASGSPQGAAMDSRGTGNKMPTPEGASLNRNKGRSMEGHDLHGSISEGDSDTIDQTDERGFAVHDPVSLADGSDEQDKRGTELLSQDDEEESDQGLKRCGTERAADVSYTSSEMYSRQKRQHKKRAVKVDRKKAKRTLVMTSMSSEKRHTVLQLVNTLRGFSVVDTVCETTTHVVTGSPRRTLNVLLGIARGCWILSFEWILWCLEHRRWIPEEPYELSDDFPAAPICRLQQHLSAGEHQQDLFSNQPAMFVSPQSQPPAPHLSELIRLCGGTVCKSVRQAGICVGEYRGKKPEGARSLSEQWVLDCLTHLKQLPYENYDLEWKS